MKTTNILIALLCTMLALNFFFRFSAAYDKGYSAALDTCTKQIHDVLKKSKATKKIAVKDTIDPFTFKGIKTVETYKVKQGFFKKPKTITKYFIDGKHIASFTSEN